MSTEGTSPYVESATGGDEETHASQRSTPSSPTLHLRFPVEGIAARFGRLAAASRMHPLPGQIVRFAAVGGASTTAYGLLFLVLQPLLGGQPANVLSLLLTMLGSTWAHRRFTFEITGSRGVIRHQVQGLAVFGLAWGVTAGSLLALQVIDPSAGAVTDMVVLAAANLVEGAVRFLLLRGWVFRPRRVGSPGSGAVAELTRTAVDLGSAVDALRSGRPRELAGTAGSRISLA